MHIVAPRSFVFESYTSYANIVTILRVGIIVFTYSQFAISPSPKCYFNGTSVQASKLKIF